MNEFAKAFVIFLQNFLPADFSLSSLVFLLFIIIVLSGCICLLLISKIASRTKQCQEIAVRLATAEKNAADALERNSRQDIREAKLSSCVAGAFFTITG